MKKSILLVFAMMVVSVNAQSNEVANSTEGSSRSYRSRIKIDALEFFETLVNENPRHPDNKRDPNWPDKLTRI